MFAKRKEVKTFSVLKFMFGRKEGGGVSVTNLEDIRRVTGRYLVRKQLPRMAGSSNKNSEIESKEYAGYRWLLPSFLAPPPAPLLSPLSKKKKQTKTKKPVIWREDPAYLVHLPGATMAWFFEGAGRLGSQKLEATKPVLPLGCMPLQLR